MNKAKPVYLLAGGRGSGNKDAFRAVFAEIAKPNPLIAYVGAASSDNRVFFRYMEHEIGRAGACTVRMARLASPRADLEKAGDILQKADAIFMSGGDVDAGMEVLISRNMPDIFRELYEEGKVFFGASAGSIMLAREWVRWADPDDDASARLFPCLDIAPVLCDTHAEKDDWEELMAALRLGKENGIGFGIPTGACLRVCPDGYIEALGGPVTRYARKGRGIVRLDDLAVNRRDNGKYSK